MAFHLPVEAGRVRLAGSLEARISALCFAMVLPFTVFVLLSGPVSPLELAGLMGLFVGMALGRAITALILFAAVEFVRSGRRSNWQGSPTAALTRAAAERWAEDRLFSLACSRLPGR